MTKEKFNNYDVFRSFLVANADYDGYFEIPVIRTSELLPDKVVTFSKAMSKLGKILTVGWFFTNMT